MLDKSRLPTACKQFTIYHSNETKHKTCASSLTYNFFHTIFILFSKQKLPIYNVQWTYTILILAYSPFKHTAHYTNCMAIRINSLSVRIWFMNHWPQYNRLRVTLVANFDLKGYKWGWTVLCETFVDLLIGKYILRYCIR